MSFAGMAAWQALALLVVAGAAAAYLFRLKIRPPRVNVASLLLWRRVLDQRREETWWERVRRAVSLAATILIAIALALAVTRPGPPVSAESRGRLLIVIDSSWSMLAERGDGRTRWDAAIAQARALALSAGGEAVAVATTADGLVEGPTTDTALIETALDQLEPAGGEDGAWPRVGGADAVHFFTDGAIARPLDRSVTVHSVYDAAPNVAIVAFAVRPAATGSTSGEAYLEVANYSPDAQRVSLTVTRGTAVVFDEPVEMAAGEAIRQVIPVDAAGDPRIRARVAAPGNALAIDDEAVAWLTQAEPLAVTLVSSDPGALGTLLGKAGSLQTRLLAPADYQPVTQGVVVFDRWVPAEAPAVPALLVAPPAAPWLGAQAAEEREPRWSAAAGHPVVEGVDPMTVSIDRLRPVEHATLTPVATSEAGTAIVSVRDQADARLVVLQVAVGDSNLANATAFPVLVANTLEWLARPALESPRRPGPMLLPESTTRVVTPDGQPLPLRAAGRSVVARLQEPGLYRVDIGGAHSVVAVNVGGAEVSNLSRASLPDEASAVTGGGLSGRPWWVYALGLAFVLAVAEWWTWLRRITV